MTQEQIMIQKSETEKKTEQRYLAYANATQKLQEKAKKEEKKHAF